MAVSERQKGYAQKYLTEKVEEFKVRVPKGEKSLIQEHAKTFDKSLNAFVLRAISEQMKRDTSDKKPEEGKVV